MIDRLFGRLEPAANATRPAGQPPTSRVRGGLPASLAAEALAHYLRIIKEAPDNTNAYITLSAILNLIAKTRAARAKLEEGLRIKPHVTSPCNGTLMARVLETQGVENAFFTLGRENMQLYGGNFSSSLLLNKNRFERHVFYIFGENILSYDDLPDYDIIVNCIACADLENRSLRTLSKFLRGKEHVSVINHPDKVLETSRDNNYRRLKHIDGIVFPKTVRVTTDRGDRYETAKKMIDREFSFPVLIRIPGTHTGMTLKKADNMDDINQFINGTIAEEFYLTQYVDCPSFGKYYRKLRYFCIDGELYPVVCYIDDIWNVHSFCRKATMVKQEWTAREEEKFLTDDKAYIGPENYMRIKELCDIIDLDFFGIDFNIRPDGSILIFEANPAMRHHQDFIDDFPYTLPFLQDISKAFEAMIGRRIGRTAAESRLATDGPAGGLDRAPPAQTGARR